MTSRGQQMGMWNEVKRGTCLNRFATVEDDAGGEEIRIPPVARSRRKGWEV